MPIDHEMGDWKESRMPMRHGDFVWRGQEVSGGDRRDRD
jgi:hypothetical protein